MNLKSNFTIFNYNIQNNTNLNIENLKKLLFLFFQDGKKLSLKLLI